MASQMDFMMQLYMMSLLQQQQQQIQVLRKSEEPQTPTEEEDVCAGPANSNLNALQTLLLNNLPVSAPVPATTGVNPFVNNFMFPHFSSSFLPSSTVTSTPTSLLSDNDRTSGDVRSENSESRFLSPIENDSNQSGYPLNLRASDSFSPLKTPRAQDYSKTSSSSTDTSSRLNGELPAENFCEAELSSRGENSLCSSDILQEENLKNLKKFSSSVECESPLCRQEHLREHFHCYDSPCSGRSLNKKEEIVRHLKWHKKRKESLNFGFMRFSASDDCAASYGPDCAYNGKQTHYHCVVADCPKVYVSTSDVQMHANFHRKNSQIFQEGFQRFRAVDDCKSELCPFSGKSVSHFHCRRDNCQHTFKNKSDMDKHKSYHLKDSQLIQDGFKKIMKTETCPFEDCRFSTVCNHIHCVREGCSYILHSSSQMISHKRKHERQEGEQAYQEFKEQQKCEESSRSQDSYQSTPLSSLTANASSFLSRKRGRPRKETENAEKKMKLDPTLSMANMLPMMIPPFMPQQLTGAPASSQDLTAANFQLTHMMAMFQLQNPLVQNMYAPGIFPGLASTFPSGDCFPQVKKEGKE